MKEKFKTWVKSQKEEIQPHETAMSAAQRVRTHRMADTLTPAPRESHAGDPHAWVIRQPRSYFVHMNGPVHFLFRCNRAVRFNSIMRSIFILRKREIQRTREGHVSLHGRPRSTREGYLNFAF